MDLKEICGIELIQPRIGIIGEPLRMRHWTCRFHKPWSQLVQPLNQTKFHNRSWVFQQDSAPAHKAKTTQNSGLKIMYPNLLVVIRMSVSPDLNLLDYKLWSVLEGMVCTRQRHNLVIEAGAGRSCGLICTDVAYYKKYVI